MPLRREVNTLQQLCKEVIVKNLSKYPKKELHGIPLHLSEELVENFDDAKKEPTSCDRWHRNRLIQPNMRKLTITSLDEIPNEKKVLNTLTNLTWKLRSGNIQEFLNLLRFTPNIVVLTTSTPHVNEINDDVMEAIGDWCSELEVLILGQSLITDDGIRRLCQSKSGGSKLKCLQLDSDYVTTKGCLFALRNLKKLKVLDCKKLVDAFKYLFQECVSTGASLPSFQLNQFPRIRVDDIPNGTLDFITRCCPNVSILSLDFYGINFSNFINDLKNCSERVSFKIRSKCEISMSDMVDIGCKIMTLFLFETNTNLESIGFSCPNLQELVLINVTFYPFKPTSRRNCQVPFTNLKKLFVSGPITIPQGRILLENCLDLAVIAVQNNYRLTDDVMLNLLHEVNPLKHLTHLLVWYCNEISKESIFELLRMENQLQLLSIRNCFKITNSDLDEIKSHVKKNNYCIVTEF